MPGFTLLEILLSLALIALLAGVLVSGAVQLIGDKPVSVDDVFWKVVQQARTTALNHEREVRVTFDPKEKNFIVDDGAAPQTFPLPPGKGDTTVDFLSTQSGASTVLIGGELVDTQTIPYVTFYDDGTCSPFRVQIRSNGPAHIVSIDPWTCAKVLTAAEATP